MKIIISNTVLVCFLKWAMKYSITTDKLSLSSLSSSQLSQFSFLCSGRVSAHLPHVSPHYFVRYSQVQAYTSKCFFFKTLPTKFPHFLKAIPQSLQRLLPALLYIVACCFPRRPQLPRSPVPSEPAVRTGRSCPYPAGWRRTPRRSEHRRWGKCCTSAAPRARSCWLLQTVGRHKHNPSGRLQPPAPHGRREEEGRGGAAAAPPGPEGSGAAEGGRRRSHAPSGVSALSGAQPELDSTTLGIFCDSLTSGVSNSTNPQRPGSSTAITTSDDSFAFPKQILYTYFKHTLWNKCGSNLSYILSLLELMISFKAQGSWPNPTQQQGLVQDERCQSLLRTALALTSDTHPPKFSVKNITAPSSSSVTFPGVTW